MQHEPRTHTRQVGTIPALGTVWVELDGEQRLTKLMLPDLDERHPPVPDGAGPLAPEIVGALEAYVAGDEAALWSLAIAPGPTPFIDQVRKAMRAIGYGKVASYGEIAKAIGKPGAARAVGRVCATNNVLLAVPCHRVVASDGPGGFGLGMHAKEVLLGIESGAPRRR